MRFGSAKVDKKGYRGMHLHDNRIAETPLTLDAEQDWQLAATLFTAADKVNSGPVVLISSASAVPQTYYRHFARHLVTEGATAVLTFDYRGMSASSGDRRRWRHLRMFHWDQFDFVAATRWLIEHYPNHELVGLGHSYGGQALGLSGESDKFSRYAGVATLSGYWRNLATPYSVWLKTQVAGRFLSHVLGCVPKGLSPGETFPGPIMLDWADWILKSDYWFDADDVPGLENYAKVTLPYLSVGLNDDPWGTKAALHAFMRHYTNADVKRVWLSPGDSGPLEHLGYFRRRHAANHWPIVTDFLLNR